MDTFQHLLNKRKTQQEHYNHNDYETDPSKIHPSNTMDYSDLNTYSKAHLKDKEDDKSLYGG